jgi:hypothetical protein
VACRRRLLGVILRLSESFIDGVIVERGWLGFPGRNSGPLQLSRSNNQRIGLGMENTMP